MSEPSKCSAGVSAETLLAYLDHALPEVREVALESHLAACVACQLLSRRLRAAGDLLLHAASSAPGLLERQELVIQALAEEQSSGGTDLVERLRVWQAKLSRSSRSLVSTIYHAAVPGEDETRQALASWGWLWPVELALPTLGPRKQTGSPRRVLPAPDLPNQLKVTWVAENNIEVEVRGLPAMASQPMVLLIPIRRDAKFRRRAILRPDPQKSSRWIALFEQVEAGSYLVALEPMEPGKGN